MPKEVRLNIILYFIMKIPNKRELQQTVINNSSDVDFMKIKKIYTAESNCFLVNDITLPSINLLRFRKNLLE